MQASVPAMLMQYLAHLQGTRTLNAISPLMRAGMAAPAANPIVAQEAQGFGPGGGAGPVAQNAANVQQPSPIAPTNPPITPYQAFHGRNPGDLTGAVQGPEFNAGANQPWPSAQPAQLPQNMGNNLMQNLKMFGEIAKPFQSGGIANLQGN